MKGREFLALAVASLALACGALAQQAGTLRRIVFPSTAVPDHATGQALTQGLADSRYVDGKTIVLKSAIAPTIDVVAEYAAKAVTSFSPRPLR